MGSVQQSLPLDVGPTHASSTVVVSIERLETVSGAHIHRGFSLVIVRLEDNFRFGGTVMTFLF